MKKIVVASVIALIIGCDAKSHIHVFDGKEYTHQQMRSPGLPRQVLFNDNRFYRESDTTWLFVEDLSYGPDCALVMKSVSDKAVIQDSL